MEKELTEIGDAVLALLSQKYAQTVFAVWFRDLQLVSLTGEEAVLSTKGSFKIGFLETKYAAVISECFAEVLGFPVRLSFVCREEGSPPPVAPPPPLEEEEEEPYQINIRDMENPRTIVEQYTFENFIVASSNKFAHAACLAVARTACNESEKEYQDIKSNPLFIYGKSGLGKTHLLYAITNEIKKKKNDVKIIYKKGEDFTNEFIIAMQNNSTAVFRAYYRSADVLLIDDIQFIAGKVATQEEFFHTFSALYEAGRQIILTCDRPPREIRALEERLLTRFEWGLPVDIQPPSVELRIAIIRKKAQVANLEMPPEVVTFLADNLTENIRQIEGAIRRIKGICLISSTPVTVELCRRAIADFLQRKTSSSDIVDKIFHTVSRKYKVGIEDIRGKKRNENIAQARHICIYLIRQLTDLSQSSIGVYFDRDHTTVINSIKNIENAILNTPDMQYEIEEMITDIKE